MTDNFRVSHLVITKTNNGIAMWLYYNVGTVSQTVRYIGPFGEWTLQRKLKREAQACFQNPTAISAVDISITAVSFKIRIIGIAVIQITTRIRIDLVATPAENI